MFHKLGSFSFFLGGGDLIIIWGPQTPISVNFPLCRCTALEWTKILPI